MDIQHMKTVKQLNATDMTKTTKLTMRLVTIYIQSINARRVTINIKMYRLCLLVVTLLALTDCM